MMRRAVKLVAAAVLILAFCRFTDAMHDRAQAAQLDRAREAFEAQRLEAVAAISETEDIELKRLGLVN